MTEIYFSRVLKAGNCFLVHQFSSVCLVMSNSLWPPWTVTCQASLSSNNSWSLLKLMSIESVMPSNYLILCRPLLLLPLPASGSFPMSRLFASGGQSIGASALASILSMNTQGWCPLGFADFISLLFKGLSRVFSSTTVQRHQFFGT